MKLLFLSALSFVVAAPALAGLTPEALSPAEIAAASGGVSRSGVYAPNDAGHVYDMMSMEFMGPEDLAYQLRQNQASGAICNLIHLRPGATSISSIHLVVDNRLGAPGARTMSIAFRNYNGPGNSPVGAFLTTASVGFSAWYVFGGMPFGGINLMTFDLGNFDANVTQTSIWVCLQANYDFRVRGGGTLNNVSLHTERHGNPGDGTPSSLYIGSGSGYFASLYPGGGGIGSASLFSSFRSGEFNPVNTVIGNWHMALGGGWVPEPATGALIGVIGVGVLRRRRLRPPAQRVERREARERAAFH